MRVAVLGAGTMGAGIAQLALQHGHEVTLYDVTDAMLVKGRSSLEGGLQKLVEKGKLEAATRDGCLGKLRCTTVLAELTDVDLAIEAAPESMQLKQDLFRFLDEFCRPDAVLASNTSSLSITAVAAACRRPQRVLGLHFFNPAPLMALVEVIAAQQTGPEALALATEFARSLGKTAVRCVDTPGFIVNRVARPFYGEALKILGEGGGSVAALDATMKAGGFRMGPFELMDLIGLDVNFAVTQSVYTAFFGEARFKPHPIQQRMVAAGRLGRKSGGGFYGYPHEPQPLAQLPAASLQRVAIVGEPPALSRWGKACVEAGVEPVLVDATHGWPADALNDVDAVLEVGPVASPPGPMAAAAHRQQRQRLIAEQVPAGTRLLTTDLTRTATAAMADHGLPTAVLGDWSGGALEVALADQAPDPDALLGVLGALKLEAVQLTDHLGLAFARIVAMLVNEASFALQEGVASPEDIDRALELGANYPQGPLAWGDRLGPAQIVALLDALRLELGEERYRAAPLLRRRAAASMSLMGTIGLPSRV